MQRVHGEEGEGDTVGCAVGSDGFEGLENAGALVIAIDRELLVLDRAAFGVRSKTRLCSVEREGEQVAAGVGGVDDLEAELLGEGLVGEPGLLLVGVRERLHHTIQPCRWSSA